MALERIEASLLRSSLAQTPELPWVVAKVLYGHHQGPVQLRPQFDSFYAACAAATISSSSAKLYYFDPAEVVISRRNPINAETYKYFLGDAMRGKRHTVHVYEPVEPDAASPPDAPPLGLPSLPDESKSTGSRRSGPLQTEFCSVVRLRDGKVCVLCANNYSSTDWPDAAHIVPHGASAKTTSTAGLLSAWDVRNGVMLCRVCHAAFDRFLWSVSPLGVVVVSAALLSAVEDDVKSYWLERNGRYLKTPASLENWPRPQTWAAHAAGCVTAQALRHTNPKVSCDVCGKLCKSDRGVAQHKLSPRCAQNARLERPVMFTPKAYGKRRGKSPSGRFGY